MPPSGIARPKLQIIISEADEVELTRRTKTPSSTVHAALRARVVLLAAEGLDNVAIASELETSHVAVGLWRSRFLDEGLPGLTNEPRPGRPYSLPNEKLQKVITDVVRPPAGA